MGRPKRDAGIRALVAIGAMSYPICRGITQSSVPWNPAGAPPRIGRQKEKRKDGEKQPEVEHRNPGIRNVASQKSYLLINIFTLPEMLRLHKMVI